ncbi:unnamed protein product [Pieris brassicae]|uniref:Uncharacterized protein n=1 Tax=Pieris brassicae TaxID=7116 RepID=A0A9P0TI25_PIEBR|nr:unnamed protein product [Pieris brassicae]
MRHSWSLRIEYKTNDKGSRPHSNVRRSDIQTYDSRAKHALFAAQFSVLCELIPSVSDCACISGLNRGIMI